MNMAVIKSNKMRPPCLIKQALRQKTESFIFSRSRSLLPRGDNSQRLESLIDVYLVVVDGYHRPIHIAEVDLKPV